MNTLVATEKAGKVRQRLSSAQHHATLIKAQFPPNSVPFHGMLCHGIPSPSLEQTTVRGAYSLSTTRITPAN